MLLSGTALAAPSDWMLKQPAAPTFQNALDAYNSGDINLAYSHAKTAAEAGDSDAQVLTGRILQKGETGLIDYLGAVQWYTMAANQGHIDAYVALGEMALLSQGGLTPAEAPKWLLPAAENGRTDAMRVLADMYINGMGVVSDPQRGQDWLSKAAEASDPD